jgi:hypothetical protein
MLIFMRTEFLHFSSEAVLVLPDRVTDCEGVLVNGNRDMEGRPQVLCSFYPGALARQLERAAEDAEEQ